MKNILNIDNGIPTLLSNVDDGTNTLYINDELVPSSEWTGTGYYTFTSGGLTFTIRKIRDTSGNIMLQLIEQSGGTSYRLIKAVSTDDKYYSIDDPAETDLADGDYVPFYDTSAGAKKKSLWSNIVDKIKDALGIASSGNTYLKKDGTWDTPIRGTFFGTCDTAADQSVKVITLSDSKGFSLLPGVVIGVKYTYTNTKLICSLNVNNTGQIRVAIGEQTPLMHNQAYMFGKAGYTTYYMYDGQYWNFLNHNGNIENNYWVSNTSARDGYVTAGGSNTNCAWKTNSVGEPSWDIDVAVLPQVHYRDLPSQSTSDNTYFKEWLVYICQNYTGKCNSGRPIVCRVNPNSIGTVIGMMYGADLHATTKLPRYSAFIYIPLGTGTIKRFGTLDYTYYFTS